MKKMTAMCMLALCLAAQGLSAKVITLLDVYMDASTEEQSDRIREEFRDPERVKTLLRAFLGKSYDCVEMLKFKRKFGVSDEPMQTVLMGIIREESAKTARPGGGDYDNTILQRAVRWLSVCADTKAKQFLVGLATDNAVCETTRIFAVQAYMFSADAREARDVFPRLLADDMREGKDGLNIASWAYGSAFQAYDEAQEDPQKRESIIAALSAVLAREKDNRLFPHGDKMLAERSAEWVESPRRKAALERFGKQPEKPE